MCIYIYINIHIESEGKLGSNKCGGMCEMGWVGTAKSSHRGPVIIQSAGVSSDHVGRRTSAVRSFIEMDLRGWGERLEVNAMCFLIEERDRKSSTGSNFKQDMKRHVADLCRVRFGLPVDPRRIGTRCAILYLKVCGETSLLFRKCSEARWSLENTVLLCSRLWIQFWVEEKHYLVFLTKAFFN